jgi:hypothetical protein
MKNLMSWSLVVALLPTVAFSKPGDVGCVVEEFRTLAMTVHNPTERLAAATQWLRVHGDACSAKDIAYLKSSSAGWLGTADSPAIQQVFDAYYSAKTKGEVIPAPSPAAAVAPAAEKAKAVVSTASEKAAASAVKATATEKATKDLTAAALASAMTTAAASKAATSLSKMK